MWAGGDAFVIGNVGVEITNVQSNKKSVWGGGGDCPSCTSLLRKCVVSFMNDRVVSVQQRFEMVVNCEILSVG